MLRTALRSMARTTTLQSKGNYAKLITTKLGGSENNFLSSQRFYESDPGTVGPGSCGVEMVLRTIRNTNGPALKVSAEFASCHLTVAQLS